MDKNAIKRFAVWARTELIARVSLKGVEYGITEDNIEDTNADSVGGKVLTTDEKKQRQALIAEINDKGYEQVMEEVAYTWFNRFSALRFMEVNSLGRLWLEGHPDVKEQLLPTEEEQSAYAAGNRDPEDTKWHYYLEEAEQEPEVQTQLAEIRKEYAALTPDQLKVIDPCSGSGHILAYMFDVLMKIYESYGYTTREAVASIVENALYE